MTINTSISPTISKRTRHISRTTRRSLTRKGTHHTSNTTSHTTYTSTHIIIGRSTTSTILKWILRRTTRTTIRGRRLTVNNTLRPIRTNGTITSNRGNTSLLYRNLQHPQRRHLLRRQSSITLHNNRLFRHILRLTRTSTHTPIMSLHTRLRTRATKMIVALLPNRHHTLTMLFNRRNRGSLLLLLQQAHNERRCNLWVLHTLDRYPYTPPPYPKAYHGHPAY